MDETVGDVGLIVKSESMSNDDPDYVSINFEDDSTYYYGLRYEEFISPIVKTIQKQQEDIKSLQEKNRKKDEEITMLKERLDKLGSIILKNTK